MELHGSEYGSARHYEWDEIVKYMKDGEETHVIVSGGEPCMHSRLGNLVDALTDLGLSVGLSTNGTFPDRLDEMVRLHGVDFVAMDVKTGTHNYDAMALLMKKEAGDPEVAKISSRVEESIRYLNALLKLRDYFTVEYRTTLYPPVIKEQDIHDIGKLLSKRAHWALQQFRPRLGLLGGNEINDVRPFNDTELGRFEFIAKEYVPSAELRFP